MPMTASLLALALVAGSAVPAGDMKVDWFPGTVPQAFARAKEEGKPLFLYWGAVWCPPCNQIKKTIFTRREFGEKMKLFVPVYLDGDSEAAQTWGERLRASGYPTMIVFGPDGKEVLRLPTGLQLDRFLELLDQALAQTTPVSQVLADALAAPSGEEVPAVAWRRLAYHSWATDGEERKDEEVEHAFRALEARVPPRFAEERARFLALWLDTALTLGAASATEGKTGRAPGAPVLAPADVPRIDGRLREILADRKLTLATLEFLLLRAGDTVRALHPRPSPERTALLEAWEEAMDRVERDETLSVDERLSALLPALEFARMTRPGKDVPAALEERVRKRVAWADSMATDSYTRQAAMVTAGQLLEQAGLAGEARKLYLEQLEKAVAPHYFMSSLAGLAREAGDKKEAVEWLGKAYETAKGKATRFQWGTQYLLGLMTLVPRDEVRIRDESRRVLGELLGFDDAFAGRNRKRLERLSKQYAAWNAGGRHRAAVAAIREAGAPGCAKLAGQGGDEPQRGRCDEFFARLGS